MSVRKVAGECVPKTQAHLELREGGPKERPWSPNLKAVNLGRDSSGAEQSLDNGRGKDKRKTFSRLNFTQQDRRGWMGVED